MGIDYGSAAAFGIKFEEGDIEYIVNPDEVDGEENPNYDEDFSESDWLYDMEDKGIGYSSYGNHFSGRNMGFIVYPEDFPKDLETFLKDGKEIYTKFLETLNEYGFNKTFDDLKFHSEALIW